MDSFVFMDIYPIVAVAYFDKFVDDMAVRRILDPLMFITTTGHKDILKTNIITPTPTQLEAIRRLVGLIQNKSALTNLSLTRRIDNATQNLGPVSTQGLPLLSERT